MTATIVLDRAGRIVIPKALREELQLEPGDSFQLECHGEQILLTPIRAAMPIRKEDGVWVYRSGAPVDVSIQQLIEAGRDERRAGILGTSE